MTFSEPLFLRIGAIMTLVVVASLLLHARRRRTLAEFLGGKRAGRRLSRSNLYRLPWERFVLLGTAALATSLALAGPSWRAPPFDPPPPVRDVVIAIDISASMQAVDVAPTRLGRAAQIASGLIDSLDGDRVGLLLFAGGPYALAPPTFDHGSVRFLLEGVTPTIASHVDPGSMVSVGIGEATRLLTRNLDEDGERAIVLIADGERGEQERAVVAAAEAAASRGVAVHTIGVGTSEGGRMTMPMGYRSEPIVDQNGRRAISELDEATLRRIAEVGGGRYYAADGIRVEDLFRRPPPPSLRVPGWWTTYDPVALFATAALLGLLFDSLLGVRMPGATPRSIRRIA